VSSRAAARRRSRSILARLEGAYGPPARGPVRSPLETLIATILSQNTTDTNSSAGFKRLKERFASWDEVADGRLRDIRRCIRSCGLSRIKAPRIRDILRQIRARQGRLTLVHLREDSPDHVFAYLTSFEGVGPKTALCVMLFSLEMPVFPVDAHIERVTRRLGLLPQRVPAAKAHEHLTPLIAPRDRHELHLLLIAHGRATCRAHRPLCAQCVLLRSCPYGQARTKRPTPASARSARWHPH